MFHLVLECDGLSPNLGRQAAVDIAEEFTHRPWHRNVTLTWDGNILRLEADNDFDESGLGLRDEFSDAISACLSDAGYDDLRVVSVATSGTQS
jgi:hypothetical protein